LVLRKSAFLNKTCRSPNNGMGVAYEQRRETVVLLSILCWQDFIRL